MGYSGLLGDYSSLREVSDEVFLFHYSFSRAKIIHRKEWTREQFWSMAKKAAKIIKKKGFKEGDCFALCPGSNSAFDLAFRLGAVMTATVPVTINWQADSTERMLYKVQLTESRLILADSKTPLEYLEVLKEDCSDKMVYDMEQLDSEEELPEDMFSHSTDTELSRIIVFTSGTTGNPKGVKLPYRAFQANRAVFEQFLKIRATDRFAVLIVNPLHHSNSTAITDWALRRPGSHIHIIERYSSNYWKILPDVSLSGYDRLVAPVVSRHFDFLADLDSRNQLPLSLETLKNGMKKTDFLIGSAPVGPTTIRRLQFYGGRIPHVRFGSTETCLQVIGIPVDFPEDRKMRAFKRGWERTMDGSLAPGYFLGRPHLPLTRVRVVKSIDPGGPGYMVDCMPGEDGYLITKGDNLMSGYVGDQETTRQVFHEGWYTGLKDICFFLANAEDGRPDYYWVSRESTLMIRGGANYSYDQINSELINFATSYYGLSKDTIDIAVVGLRVDSEHEDSCCVTVELKGDLDRKREKEIKESFKEKAAKHVTKGARPDYVRFAKIPRNFKGAVLVKELSSEFIKLLRLQ